MTALTIPNTSAVRTAIQNRLVLLGRQGRFFKVEYDHEGFARSIDPDEAEKVEPASCLANEVTGTWEDDGGYGRGVAQRRTSWVFELLLEFNCEVSLEFFEHDIATQVPRIDTPVGSFSPRLRRGQYQHPTQKSASSGTSVIYTCEIFSGRF